MELKVIKRSARVEEFNAEKIKRGVMKAGATVKLAGSVATNTAKWAKDKAADGGVLASDLHSKVLEFLYESDREVADSFKNFMKRH